MWDRMFFYDDVLEKMKTEKIKIAKGSVLPTVVKSAPPSDTVSLASNDSGIGFEKTQSNSEAVVEEFEGVDNEFPGLKAIIDRQLPLTDRDRAALMLRVDESLKADEQNEKQKARFLNEESKVINQIEAEVARFTCDHSTKLRLDKAISGAKNMLEVLCNDPSEENKYTQYRNLRRQMVEICQLVVKTSIIKNLCMQVLSIAKKILKLIPFQKNAVSKQVKTTFFSSVRDDERAEFLNDLGIRKTPSEL